MKLAFNIQVGDHLKNRLFYRPLIAALLGQMSGILLGTFFPGYFWLLFVAFCFVTTGLLYFIRDQRPSFWLPMLLMMLAGWVSIQPFTAPQLSSDHISRFADGSRYTLSGIITTEPKNLVKRVRMKVSVEAIHSSDGMLPVTGWVQLTTSDALTGRLHLGDRIRFSGRLTPVHGFSNPGGFDYRRYLLFQGIHCRMWGASDQILVLERDDQKRYGRSVDQWRDKVSHQLESTVSDPSRSILKALIIGDRSGVDGELRRVFSRCGVAHLLAISGLHVAIVGSLIFLPLCWLLGFGPPLLQRGLVMKAAALFTIPAVVAYGFLTGMSPSTQRAVLMVSIFLLALLSDQWQEPFNTLAVAALVILSIDPPALFAVAFQLSFAAVAMILWGERLWARLKMITIDQRERSLSRHGWGLLRVSLFAYLGTLPLVAHYFNEVSLIAVAVNLLAVPIIGYGIVPLGLLGLALFAFSDMTAAWVWGATGWLLEMIYEVMTTLAGLEFSAVFLVTPNWLEITLYYAMLISGGFLLAKAILILRGRNEVSPINLKPFIYIFTGALVLGLADTGYWYYQRHWRTTLRATILDVGTGSANLVEFPHGKVMLIDGGGFTDNTLFDVGRAIVAPVLWFKKIKKIDYLVLTHPNSDHLNGLIFIAEHFDIGEVWQTGWEYNTLGYHQFQQILAQRNLSVPVWIDLPKKQQINNVTVDLLWPPQEPDSPEIWPDTNNQSLVIKMTQGTHSIIFPGDIERPAEMALLRKYGAQLNSTVLLAPHHGSRTSSSQLFLEAVSPKLVIVSSAAWGRYPFPHPVIRQRYQRLEIEILETAQQGAITIDFKKDGLLVRKEKTPL